MIRIGKIVGVHGVDGAVVMTHIAEKSDWLRAGDVLHIEVQKDSRIPYFTTAVNESKNNSLILRLEDVGTVEQGRRLIGKHVYVKEEQLPKIMVDSPLLWIGWVGKITYKGIEALLPLVPPVLQKVDLKTQQIQLELPEGLLDVYLNPGADNDEEEDSEEN
jgi:16S rRNA processing protein RimM